MKILGIETSCDETSTAIYDTERGLLSHCVYSQIKTHAPFGGVVPELASRDHVRKTLPLVKQALIQAGITVPDGVAYTKGPGLIGALMVGASIGRALGYAWNIPALGVHHMEAHLMAAMLDERKPTFPFVTLLVSGGHTLLIEVKGLGDYKILGESLDDAVGEAFDKTAKLLGLPYPGGPHLAKLAEKGRAGYFYFPRPMTDRPGLDFSFSGIKTFAVNCIRENKQDEQTKANISYAKQTGLKQIVMAGGVSANKRLRETLKEKLEAEVFYPPFEFCTDNGAMVAYLGAMRLQRGEKDHLEIKVHPRWGMEDLYRSRISSQGWHK